MRHLLLVALLCVAATAPRAAQNAAPGRELECPLSLTPQQPHYSGKVVVLVDEEAVRQILGREVPADQIQTIATPLR